MTRSIRYATLQEHCASLKRTRRRRGGSGEAQPRPVALGAEREAHARDEAPDLVEDLGRNGRGGGCGRRRALDAHGHQEGYLAAPAERPHAQRGAAVVTPPDEEVAAARREAGGRIGGRRAGASARPAGGAPPAPGAPRGAAPPGAALR